MTFQIFSQSLNKFYEKGQDKGIRDLPTMLAKVRAYFLNCYDEIDEKEFAVIRNYGASGADKKAQIRMELVSTIRRLNRDFKGCSNPKMDFKALERLFLYFFDEKGNVRNARMVQTISERTDFYRMRSAEGYRVYKREEMFQISGEKRNLTSKLRFSDDGHPCLYLGQSLYIAWEEVRRPSFETVNFARFSNTKPLTVLDLTVRRKFRNPTDFIMSYLCLLTSAKVEDGDKYKYRYEVSGLIMKLLQNSISRSGNVDGIKYVSSRQFEGKDIVINGNSIMLAYVFPPKGYTVDGVDAWLKSTFAMTAPRTFFLYNIHQINFVNPREAVTSDYQDTLFYQIEQQLKKEKVEKLQ